mgnify:FL=1|tara:strand:- start:371 stop:1048 length:678 start_codon:yes stop_codon:yes gene_type:complete
MLSLSQKLSLNRIRPQGGWTPGSDNVVAWYKMATGITLNGSDVSQWSDSSGNGYHMLQSDAAQQPAYSAGVLTFDPTSNECLELSGTQISLTGDFTVGIRFNVTATTGVLLADQTATGEFLRFQASNKIRLKVDGTAPLDFTLNSGNFGGEQYMVLTRSSGTCNLWVDGVQQTSSGTKTGTADIDAIGIRKTDVNPYDGTMREVQIYSSTSADLTANVNAWLATL